MKSKSWRAPTTKSGVRKQMHRLSEHMLDVATSMEYYGGFGLTEHERHIIGMLKLTSAHLGVLIDDNA